MTDPQRPDTAAGCLKAIAEILTTYEDGFEVLGNALGEPAPEGLIKREPQSALRMMADWLEIHPEVDAQLISVVEPGDWLQ